jgi:3-hydroxybutyryl-CoA dehydrogenase
MGPGIAQVAAVAGITTFLVDVEDAALLRARTQIQGTLAGAVTRKKLTAAEAEAALDRIRATTTLEDAVPGAELVIEAIVESLAEKCTLFSRLDEIADSDALLATNTSSLSVASIASATRSPDRVVGMHFFNPVHIMKLVEVVAHAGASRLSIERAQEMSRVMGKHPIVVRDSPGFASSRLGVALGLEAMRMLQEDVASAEDIDTAMELGYGHAMGPLRVSDLVGLDVRLSIAEYLHSTLGTALFEPPAILKDKVAGGELGKKTGKGFYQWPRTS